MPAPSSPPISAWLLLDGMPSTQVMTFQAIAPISAPKITCASMTSRVDDALADGLRDVQAEEQEGDEVEERRPEHRVLRLQHARRDDGRDRIGGIVQAVQEIEQQRDADQADQQREARCVIVAASGVVDHETLDLVRDILEPVDDLLQMAVDFAADDEGHRRRRRRAP